MGLTMPLVLIMAGGRSERMRSTLGPLHKALVPVLGVPMIERNLRSLLSQGFRELVVACSVDEPAVQDFVRLRGQALAAACGARCEILLETEPLGTIGVARELRDRSSALMVVNVDNLTTLDLRELVSHHRREGVWLTIATHTEPFKIPFGEVVVEDGKIREYREKPTFPVTISSGTYVLSAQACSILPPARTDIPELVRTLNEQGKKVSAFRHDSEWVDVNNAFDLDIAERLIAGHQKRFDCSEAAPEQEEVTLLARSSEGVIVSRSTDGSWHLPSRLMEGTAHASLSALVQLIPFSLGTPSPFAVFDDFAAKGQVTRYHLYRADLRTAHTEAGSFSFLPLDFMCSQGPANETTSVVRRALALLRYQERLR
jgi:NDP-sugar pyrophosphorylase family protein